MKNSQNLPSEDSAHLNSEKVSDLVSKLKITEGVNNLKVETLERERQSFMRLTFYHNGKKYFKEISDQPEKIVNTKYEYELDDNGSIIKERNLAEAHPSIEFTPTASQLERPLEDTKVDYIIDQEIREKEQLLKVEIDLKKECEGQKYFYHFQNHNELYKLGISFNQDFDKGIQHFAFYDESGTEEVHSTILGLTSYFGQKFKKINILIIGSDFHKTSLKHLHNTNNIKSISLDSERKPNINKFETSPEFLDYKELSRFVKEYDESRNLEKILKFFCADYDLVLWQSPTLKEFETDKELYYHAINCFQNISFVTDLRNITFKKLEEEIKFFNNYNIPVKGIIPT